MSSTILTVPLVESKLFDSPEPRRIFDIERMAYFIAAQESAEFFVQHMRLANNLISSPELLKYALAQRNQKGLTLEFGVATGATFRIIADQTKDTVYGFDSFEGLPTDWTHFQKTGRFSSSGLAPEGLPSNAELVIGYFEKTLTDFLEKHDGPVNFVHIDCDLYSSTSFVLTELASRVVAGTIIVFDEYFNYPGWQHNEHKAFTEFLTKSKFDAEYLGFASSGQSIAVRLFEKQERP